MKTAYANGIRYIYDIGNIKSVKYCECDHAIIQVNNRNGKTKDLLLLYSPPAVMGLGKIGIHWEKDGVYQKGIMCNDPRVIYIYLWNVWRHNNGEEMGLPPIPTMEEAREWVEKADIPPIPLDLVRPDFPSEKLKNFLLGGSEYFNYVQFRFGKK